MSSLQTGPVRIKPSESESFVSIQCLRGIAAFLVVLTHALGGARLKFPDGESLLISCYYLKDFCASGVDIFFVISGCPAKQVLNFLKKSGSVILFQFGF